MDSESELPGRKTCGMSIAEMKQYLALCMEGKGTIPERKVDLVCRKKKKRNLAQIHYRNCKRQWHTLTGSRDSMTMCSAGKTRITVTSAGIAEVIYRYS